MSAADRRVIVGGLDAYSRYSINLTPYDRLGPGAEKWNDSVCTDPGVPTASPKLTLDSFTNTSVTLNFSTGGISPVLDHPFACPGSYSPSEHLHGPFHGYLLSLEALSSKIAINVTINNQTEVDFYSF